MSEGMFDPELLDRGSNGAGNANATSPPDDDSLNRFMDEALGSVLRSARESAAAMMERAKHATEEEALEMHRLHEDAVREVERMTAWREQIAPLVLVANVKAEQIQRAVADVPGRVADALAPVNEALADMDTVMRSLTDALRPPAGGPSGSGGPNGGSRSKGSTDTAMPTVDPVQEPVRERVEAVRDEADADVPVQETAADAHPVAETRDDERDSKDMDAAVDAEPAATVEAQDETADPEADAVPDEDGSTSSAPKPRWVDWPSNGDGGTASNASAETDENETVDGPSAQSDEDDAALMSTTTQLRRAVTDIDWHDLPSASKGWTLTPLRPSARERRRVVACLPDVRLAHRTPRRHVPQAQGRGKLHPKQVDGALDDIRTALLDADVALDVVDDFLGRVRARALSRRGHALAHPRAAGHQDRARRAPATLGGEYRPFTLPGANPVVDDDGRGAGLGEDDALRRSSPCISRRRAGSHSWSPPTSSGPPPSSSCSPWAARSAFPVVSEGRDPVRVAKNAVKQA